MDLNTQEQFIKNYEVIRVMGQGSYGKVFLVRNIHNQSQYAMKKYSYYFLKKNGKDLSLQRSVKILQSLSHKCILKIVKYIITKDDSIYLFFQPCKKGSLEKIKSILIKAEEHQLIDLIIFQIVQGLKYLKSVSVAHRDMKPSNIAFNSQGELKIIDFDEAVCFTHNYLDEDSKLPEFPDTPSHPLLVRRRSQAMSFVGTAIYQSPQMKCKTQSDERGDCWALGCIIYELLTDQSFQIQFQDEKQLRQEISARLNTMRLQKTGQRYIPLLQKILTIDPNLRISIDQVYHSSCFVNLRKNREFYQASRNRLKKFLRGNYSLPNPRTLQDAIKFQLIGMKAGEQIFEKLKTVILLNKKYDYQLKHLIGGGQYFKLRDIKDQNQKKYIFYDEIQSIKINESLIIIKVVPQKWSHSLNKQKYEIQFKHLYDDQMMLGRLFQLLVKVFND